MKIWILNHYATDMYFDGSGRHHAFAKYLIRMGHDVKIFCATTVHNSDITVETEGNLYVEKTGEDEVPYVFVKARHYKGNGKSRILNMWDYYRNIKKVLNNYKKNEGLPSIILASSVHPLTLVAGIKWAHKNKIKCICEIRDLWPESIVEFTKLTEKNIIIKTLYKMERWIYCKADSLIFTMEGGKQYIIDKKWDKKIELEKVNYINNGVDLDVFNQNKVKYVYNNSLVDHRKMNIVYAGSIRKANNVMNLAYAAKRLNEIGVENVDIVIYGEGSDKEEINDFIKKHSLNNIRMIGKIDKKYIPNVLSQPHNVNCLNYKYADIFRYGVSQNKLFEYLASGRPILANNKMGYDIIEKYNAGIIVGSDNIDDLVDSIVALYKLSEDEYNKLCNHAKKAAEDYDFKILTKRLIDIIEVLV